MKVLIREYEPEERDDGGELMTPRSATATVTIYRQRGKPDDETYSLWGEEWRHNSHGTLPESPVRKALDKAIRKYEANACAAEDRDQ